MKLFYKTKRSSEQGMTLVEILFSMAIGVLVLGAVASILVMTAKTIHKNRLADDAANTTRKVQEHMEHYLSMAVSQSTAPFIRPVLGGTSDGLTPAHYTRIDYRISAGPIASVPGGVLKAQDTFNIYCAADLAPVVGDYLLCDYPALGTNKWGVQIIAVSDGRTPGTAGNVSIQLAQTLNNAEVAAGVTPIIDMAVNSVVTVQRPQAYEAMDPGSNPVGELHFTPHTYYPTNYVVLSKNVDATARYLFTQIPSDPTALEQSIGWQFSYATAPEDIRATAGGNSNFYQLNYTSGLIMPKTGNPLNLSGGLTHDNPPSTCTSTTSSTTSTSTTSTSSTTSTTSITTTTSSTTSTTSISTSTSSTTSISSSTTSTTSTTSISTSTTSTTSTSTSSTSTTSISTSSTSTTSTTSISTSTTSTTSTSSTSTSTSITTSTSSSISTTTSTSTTSSISTTSTTSSTTSTTSTSSTTSMPTTTIEFDG